MTFTKNTPEASHEVAMERNRASSFSKSKRFYTTSASQADLSKA